MNEAAPPIDAVPMSHRIQRIEVRVQIDEFTAVAVTGVDGDAPAYFPPERFAGRMKSEVRLARGLAIEGSVVDSKGRPVAGATVYPLPKTPMPGIQGFRKNFGVASGLDGSFRIEGLPAGGTYLVRAWHEEFGLLEQEVMLAEGEDVEIEIEFGS